MVQSMKQPQEVMILGCMSYHGFRRIQVLEGTMNAQQ